jgi:hypothetical protein
MVKLDFSFLYQLHNASPDKHLSNRSYAKDELFRELHIPVAYTGLLYGNYASFKKSELPVSNFELPVTNFELPLENLSFL